ncbi:MAG: PEGA domain-containing protein [Candidatus Aminicenantes bacterium]|nr:PEGA domain-containing protein [Candidatus Aminicenantes bacterium]
MGERSPVFINGEDYGQTPLRLELKTNQSYTIEFQREGFKTQVRHIKNEIGVGWVVLDIKSLIHIRLLQRVHMDTV